MKEIFVPEYAGLEWHSLRGVLLVCGAGGTLCVWRNSLQTLLVFIPQPFQGRSEDWKSGWCQI